MLRIVGRDSKAVSRVKKRLDSGEVVGVAYTPDGTWRIDFVIVKVEYINYSTRETGDKAIPGTTDNYYLFSETNGNYKNYPIGNYVEANYMRSKFEWPDCKDLEVIAWFMNAIVLGMCDRCKKQLDECACA